MGNRLPSYLISVIGSILLEIASRFCVLVLVLTWCQHRAEPQPSRVHHLFTSTPVLSVFGIFLWLTYLPTIYGFEKQFDPNLTMY
jgi:hypothetical protein